MAVECEFPLLGMTLLKIEQAAVADDLDAALSFVPELNEHLRVALASMSRSEVNAR
jgi:hypothetical protein